MSYFSWLNKEHTPWLPGDVEWKQHALIVEAGFACFPLKFAALHAARIPVS